MNDINWFQTKWLLVCQNIDMIKMIKTSVKQCLCAILCLNLGVNVTTSVLLCYKTYTKLSAVKK